MSVVWSAFSSQWLLNAKVSFDGATRIIYVHDEVTTLDIRTDVYSAWIRWVVLNDHAKFLPAIRFTGYDPIGSGQFTGDIYFLTNGWKLSLDLAKVRVSGTLFSDDYDTAYYTTGMATQYPASVSALVNTVTLPAAAADVWQYAQRTLTTPPPPTAEQTATAVWTHSFTSKLLTVAKFLGLK